MRIVHIDFLTLAFPFVKAGEHQDFHTYIAGLVLRSPHSAFIYFDCFSMNTKCDNSRRERFHNFKLAQTHDNKEGSGGGVVVSHHILLFTRRISVRVFHTFRQFTNAQSCLLGLLMLKEENGIQQKST